MHHEKESKIVLQSVMNAILTTKHLPPFKATEAPSFLSAAMHNPTLGTLQMLSFHQRKHAKAADNDKMSTRKSRTHHTGLVNHQTHSDTPRQTHAAAADVQQWVDATYFNVSCLVCWLHILTELISGSLVTVASLSVLTLVLLIGP